MSTNIVHMFESWKQKMKEPVNRWTFLGPKYFWSLTPVHKPHLYSSLTAKRFVFWNIFWLIYNKQWQKQHFDFKSSTFKRNHEYPNFLSYNSYGRNLSIWNKELKSIARYTANFFPIKRAGKPRVTRGTPQHARKCDGDKW